MPHPPASTETRLRNGARICFEPRPQAASAAIALLLTGGTRDQTPAEVGHLHLLEHLLLRRTASLPPPALAGRIARLGTEVNAETGREHFALLGRAPAAQVPELAALLADCLCRPAFGAADLALELGVIAAESTFVGHTPPLEALLRLAWPEHPLGRPLSAGAPAGARADAASLRALWSRQCVGARLRVAVSGAFDAAAVQQALAPLALLPAGSPPQWGPAPRFVSGRYGEAPAHRAAELLWALSCLPYDPGDTAAWELLALILEQALYESLRSAGLAYAWSVRMLAYSDAGLIVIQVQAPPGRAPHCCEVVEHCLAMLHALGPRPEQTQTARQCRQARAALALDEPERRALALASLRYPPAGEPAPADPAPVAADRLRLIV